MKSNSVSLNVNNVVLVTLGLLCALLVFAVLTGKRVPLIQGDRRAFFVLLVVGFTMCALGPMRSIPPQEWGRPMNAIAVVLGGLALLLGLVVLTGIRVPLIPDNRAAFVVLAVIILSKVVLTTVHHAWLDKLAR